MRLSPAIPLVFSLLLTACGGGNPETSSSSDSAATTGGEEVAADEQSFAEAMELICNGWVDAEETRGLSPEDEVNAVRMWILDRLTNPRANEFYEITLDLPPYERRQEVSRFAEEVGLEECAILQMWPEP